MTEIECGVRGEDHATPDCSFDWAYPIDWILDVQRVLGDEYRPLGGHMVWRYGPDDGIFGRPVGLCAEAQAVIDAYVERKRQANEAADRMITQLRVLKDKQHG